jgi:hypothetical protein
MRRAIGQAVVALAVLAACGLLYAQPGGSSKGSSPAASAKKEARGKAGVTLTPEREAAVLAFVQRNHPELADLLAYLKSNQPDEYNRATREIFRSTERLALIQERDSLQYDLEVAAWTAQSRVQLLAAMVKMGSSDELVRQLREALRAQNEAKVALLKHERQKAADRMARIDNDIARFENDREKIIDRQLQLLTQAGEGRPNKLGAKNAAKLSKKNASPPEK